MPELNKNKDFYDNLPGMVCEILDRFIEKYGKEPWFEKAWNEYRDYVLKTSIDDMRMPGFIFRQYILNDKKGDK